MANIHPEPVNFTGLQDIFTYVNVLGQGWTMTIYLTVMYVIFMSFMIRKGNKPFTAFVTATYVIAVIAGFMFPLGMIGSNVAVFFGILVGLSILVTLISIFYFKEKLNKYEYIGIFFAIMSVIFMEMDALLKLFH